MWVNSLKYTIPDKVFVTILNLRPLSDESMKVITKTGRYSFIQGNAQSLPFADKSFEIVFSNSLLDHLYTFENQKKFVEEVKKVGQSYFIQTGNKKFFFEPHYLTPFVQYLPKNFQKKVIRYATVWGLITKPSRDYIDNIVDEIILSTEHEFRKLFPDANIYNEKVLFFTKSFIAYRD